MTLTNTTVEMGADEFMKLWNTFRNAPLDSLTLMACVVIDGTMQVQPVKQPRDLLTYPDNTIVVAQWRTGSDGMFAEFTVGQVRVHISEITA